MRRVGQEVNTQSSSGTCSLHFRSSLQGRHLTRQPFKSGRCCRGTLQVVAKKGQGKKMLAQQQRMQGGQVPPTPEVDNEMVEFVIFIRSVKLPQWYPLSIVKAGQAANSLVSGLDTKWGRMLYGKTLIRNIAKSVYKERKETEKSFRSQVPILKSETSFQYAFKIRDKKAPKAWYEADNLTILPPEDKLGESFLENLRERFTGS